MHPSEIIQAADSSAAEVEKSLLQLEETEKNAVRRALTEERSRYCAFVHYLRPVLTEETCLVSEFQQLEEVTKRLGKHTDEPFKLPAASEQVTSTFELAFQIPGSNSFIEIMYNLRSHI